MLMPNGNLIVEGAKTVTVNSETQKVVVRGLCVLSIFLPAMRFAPIRSACLR